MDGTDAFLDLDQAGHPIAGTRVSTGRALRSRSMSGFREDKTLRFDRGASRTRRRPVLWIALIAPIVSALFSSPSHAQTGSIRVIVTKAALVAGAGAGRGVLTYRGRDYPFRASGLSLGFAAGASINRLFGRVSYLDDVRNFPGVYSAVGLGAALAGGVGGVQLKNAKGVIITLEGAKFGLEASANLSAVKISLE